VLDVLDRLYDRPEFCNFNFLPRELPPIPPNFDANALSLQGRRKSESPDDYSKRIQFTMDFMLVHLRQDGKLLT
jgi:hypothetical protein